MIPMNGRAHEPARPLVVPPMQHAEPFPYTGEVRRLTLGPTDRVVLKVDGEISNEVVGYLRRHLSVALDIAESRVIVLARGLELSVVEQDSAA